MRKRNYSLNMYLNLEEWLMLNKKSKKAGLTKSTLVRFLIKGYEPKEKPDDRFYEDINSIRKIGNVLNQIARRMHALGYVDDEKYLRKTVQNFNDFILDVKRKYLLPEKVEK